MLQSGIKATQKPLEVLKIKAILSVSKEINLPWVLNDEK